MEKGRIEDSLPSSFINWKWNQHRKCLFAKVALRVGTFGALVLSTSDFQESCFPHCERTQRILCGICRNNTGVSVLFNKCVSCSDGFLALIPVLILLVVIVVVIIILMDKPMPSLAMPFLFYVQTAPYTAQFFPETFDTVGKYLYYLSSASGLYFIHDFCLSDSITTTLSHLLRYIPVLVVSLVYFIVWLFRRRIFRKTLHNHGSWWLILLLYSPLTYVSFSVLNCPFISVNGTNENRWFWNGEIQCFTGGHIGLGLIAIAMSIICTLFIVLVAILPYMTFNFSKHYVEPFTAHFKENYKFWCGVELARRLLFFLALVPLPRNTVLVLLVLLISLSVYTYCFPYKSTAANILEVICHLNLIALLLLEAMPQIRQDLFVFPVHTIGDVCRNDFDSVSSVVYLLGPVYYLPVLIIVIAIVLTLVHFIWRKTNERISLSRTVVVANVDDVCSESHTTQELDINYSMDIN